MLTQARLKELLTYDPDTGLFRWSVSRGRAKAGQIAGCPRPDGYVRINVDGVLYYAHRLAFLYMTGAFPAELVDHKDGNPGNNDWSNLRPATRSQNSMNTAAHKHNRLGVKGVYPSNRRFRAAIQIDGKQVNLGSFATIAEAEAAYDRAANDNRGEFVRRKQRIERAAARGQSDG